MPQACLFFPLVDAEPFLARHFLQVMLVWRSASTSVGKAEPLTLDEPWEINWKYKSFTMYAPLQQVVVAITHPRQPHVVPSSSSNARESETLPPSPSSLSARSRLLQTLCRALDLIQAEWVASFAPLAHPRPFQDPGGAYSAAAVREVSDP